MNFFHKSLPLVYVWSQMNPAYVLPSCLYKIHFNILPPKGLSSGIFFSPPPPPPKTCINLSFQHICQIPRLFHRRWFVHQRVSNNEAPRWEQEIEISTRHSTLCCKVYIFMCIEYHWFCERRLLEDVVHWKLHGAFSFYKEWLLVSRICFINQLECGHSDWYCSWIWKGNFHERVLENGEHDWFEARFEVVLKIIPIAVAFIKCRHWSTGADISRRTIHFSCTYSLCCSRAHYSYSALLLALSWHSCY